MIALESFDIRLMSNGAPGQTFKLFYVWSRSENAFLGENDDLRNGLDLIIFPAVHRPLELSVVHLPLLRMCHIEIVHLASEVLSTGLEELVLPLQRPSEGAEERMRPL